MYNVRVERNGNIYNYTCEECGWKDSTTLHMMISKNDAMRLSLYRNDSIEVTEFDKKDKGG
jgi:hypothetical protein